MPDVIEMHGCHHRDCDVQIPLSQVMCKPHWEGLGTDKETCEEIQQRILSKYRMGTCSH